MMTDKYIKALQEQLPAAEMKSLLDPDPALCIAIKTLADGYVFANRNFLKLMGFSSLKSFMHKRDVDLCKDRNLLNIYRERDDMVYDTDKPVVLDGVIKPDRLKLEKRMLGMSHPLHLEGSKTDSVIMINSPTNQIITLSVGVLINLDIEQLKEYLTKRSYFVQSNKFSINLARMEILCLAEMLKGKNAAQIAEKLRLKQLTVESYLSNLRNKCGVGKKNELIQFFIDSHILESIVA